MPLIHYGALDVKRIWVENQYEPDFDPDTDSADVWVEMADGGLWSALFVTLPYLQEQMRLSKEHAASIAMPPVGYTALDAAHVIVEDLRLETIEDTIDCLIESEIFESVFMRFPADAGEPENGRLYLENDHD